MVKKRGAIELSMNVIIIVVIGIVLLTLGLKWVYSIFGGLEEQRRTVMEATDERIREIFGESSEPLQLLSTSLTIPQGKSSDVSLGIRNTLPETHKFRYYLTVVDSPPSAPPALVLTWIRWDKSEFVLKSGAGVRDTVSIDPSDAPLGVYKVKVIVECLDQACTEFSAQAPLTFRITPK